MKELATERIKALKQRIAQLERDAEVGGVSPPTYEVVSACVAIARLIREREGRD